MSDYDLCQYKNRPQQMQTISTNYRIFDKTRFLMNNYDAFTELNLELIAARKAILEWDRILDMMAALDMELAEKQAELPLLDARRQHEWLDVAELESTGIATIVFSALGRHEQLLAQQLQEYLETKLAVEQRQQRTAVPPEPLSFPYKTAYAQYKNRPSAIMNC